MNTRLKSLTCSLDDLLLAAEEKHGVGSAEQVLSLDAADLHPCPTDSSSLNSTRSGRRYATKNNHPMIIRKNGTSRKVQATTSTTTSATFLRPSLPRTSTTTTTRIMFFLLCFTTSTTLCLAFQPHRPTAKHLLVSSSMSSKSTILGPRTSVTSQQQRTSSAALWAASESEEIDIATMKKMEPRVYPQRWIQLAYLSALALLSDWICFSVAAVPSTFEQAFPSHSAASLIDIFLFTNVASCFLVTDVVAKFGLQRAIQSASLLMTVGCWLRSGLAFATTAMAGGAVVDSVQQQLVSYPLLVAGTVLVGAAQPFFQCTPPFLSATWFAPSERATSTAVALNFNQIGIATAFLVGGAMATTTSGLENYFGLISVASTLVTVGTFLQFQNEPPVPPSASELEKKLKGIQEPPFLESVQEFFQKPGFTKAFAAFVCSISITNIVGAFIEEVMERGGITNQLQIDLAGAGFEIAILLGGIVIGGYVDRTKEYKKVTMACLLATAFLVIPLGLTEHALGKEPLLLILSLLGLGMAAGPVQPINAELAVDVVYPGDETAVESVQQIGGNLISALLVPLAELLAKRDFQLLPGVPILESDIRGDVVLLLVVALVTLQYFSSFDAPLARSAADTEGSGETSAINGSSVVDKSPEKVAEQL